MRSHAHRAIGLIAAISLFGCNTTPPPAAKAPEKFSNRTESPDPKDASAEMKPFTPTDDGGAMTSEQLLAQKLRAYSSEVAPKLRDRAERKKLNNAGNSESPSQVAWKDPAANPTTSPSDPTANTSAMPAATIDKPITVATPAAAPAKPAPGDPIVIPEGEDIAKPLGPQDAIADSDQLAVQLAGKIKDNPRDLTTNLDYQLLQYLRGAQVPEMKSMNGLPAEDREVISSLLDGLANFRSNARNDSNQMLSDKIRPLVDMADRLRGQADLTLPAAALCTRVDGYGVYEPIEPARFGAAKDHPVIVYCEVANFASQINEKKLWETRLANEVILYTDTGMVAWRDGTKSIVDTSRNRRHDFFLIKKTKLPATLPMGRYILKISVTDQQSNRVAETNVPVQITAE